VCPLEPAPKDSASKRATENSGATCLSHAAAVRPVKPPPTTAKSTDGGRSRLEEWKSMDQGRFPQFLVVGIREVAILGGASGIG
jgi:hypothetical protein